MLSKAAIAVVLGYLADLLLRGTLVPGRIKVSTDKDAAALVFKQPKRSAPPSDK